MPTRHGGKLKLNWNQRFRFCPNCGVEGLRMLPAKRGFDLVHDLCGFSFRPMKSELEETADALHKRDRALRNGVTMTTRCVGEQIAEAFQKAGLATPVETTQNPPK